MYLDSFQVVVRHVLNQSLHFRYCFDFSSWIYVEVNIISCMSTRHLFQSRSYITRKYFYVRIQVFLKAIFTQNNCHVFLSPCQFSRYNCIHAVIRIFFSILSKNPRVTSYFQLSKCGMSRLGTLHFFKSNTLCDYAIFYLCL